MEDPGRTSRPDEGPESSSAWLARAEADALADAATRRAPTPGAAAIEEHRSPHPATCPFFRSIDPPGSLVEPVEAVDPANRCAAVGAPQPQSALQQELVCLTRVHVDCPRYERGMLARREPPRQPRALTRATVAALVILALSASASFAFVLARGGLALPGAPVAGVPGVTDDPALAVASVPVATTSPATVTPPPTATLAPATLEPAASATPAPDPTPTKAPLTPAPTRAPATQQPVSDRYALLNPCPSQSDCWLYTIRSGDNLFSIGNYFGHSLDTIYRLNPWARSTPLRPGQELVLPPPTR